MVFTVCYATKKTKIFDNLIQKLRGICKNINFEKWVNLYGKTGKIEFLYIQGCPF